MKPIAKITDSAGHVTKKYAQDLQNLKYEGAALYLGTGSKSARKGDEAKLIEQSLKIVSVYEGNPTKDAYFTSAQAVIDAQDAVERAKHIQQPDGTAIYLTVDTAVTASDYGKVVDYFKTAAQHIMPYKLGAYGDEGILTALFKVFGSNLYYWQTSAWSNGARFQHANIYQWEYNKFVGDVPVDVDAIYALPGWWDKQTPAQNGFAATPSYPSQKAKVNGKPYPAVDYQDKVYLDWTVARDLGLNLTKVTWGDVELDGKKPPQVADSTSTYILWSALDPDFKAVHNGDTWEFSTPVAKYSWSVTVPKTQPDGTEASIAIKTMENMQPLAGQVVTIYVNDKQVADNKTAADGTFDWGVSESTATSDTVKVVWVDPNKKTHTAVHIVGFTQEKIAATAVPADMNIVCQFAMTPDSDPRDGIFFMGEDENGNQIKHQLDTGAFMYMITADVAKKLNAKNLGATQIQGVGGKASAYYTQVNLVIPDIHGNKVKFTGIHAVVDPAFTSYPLFGDHWFVLKGYDLYVNHQHQTVSILAPKS